jgi:hypothetical protein
MSTRDVCIPAPPCPPPCPEICIPPGAPEWRLVVGGVLAGALSVAAVRIWQRCANVCSKKKGYGQKKILLVLDL